MAARSIHPAALVLVVVLIASLGYFIGRGRDDSTPDAVRQEISDRLDALATLQTRLESLEEAVAGLNTETADETVVETTAETQRAATGLEAIDARLDELTTRVRGLEQDPVRRGYSYLASENAELRREGVNLLARAARIDPEIRAALRELLNDPSPRVREQAAQKLRDLRDKESAPAMVALLADEDARTRRRAVQALGAADVQSAARDLGRSLVADADDRVRATAANVLGDLHATEAQEFLVEALADESDSVRAAAIVSLGEIGAGAAAPPLRALYDGDPGTHRVRLALALKALGDEAPLGLEVTRLTNVIRSSDDEQVRERAVRELATLDRRGAQAVFSQALEDPSPRVRRAAQRALD